MSDEPKPELTLYELINMSDPYTFFAPSIEVAGVATVMLSTSFGAKPVDNDGEQTPMLFGWSDWLTEKGIDKEWVERNKLAVADALDSFLIGSPSSRRDVDQLLSTMDAEARRAFIDERQDRMRSSTRRIGETAYELAASLRKPKES